MPVSLQGWSLREALERWREAEKGETESQWLREGPVGGVRGGGQAQSQEWAWQCPSYSGEYAGNLGGRVPGEDRGRGGRRRVSGHTTGAEPGRKPIPQEPSRANLLELHRGWSLQWVPQGRARDLPVVRLPWERRAGL